MLEIVVTLAEIACYMQGKIFFLSIPEFFPLQWIVYGVFVKKQP